MAVRNYEDNINPVFPSGYHMSTLGKLAKGDIDFGLAKSLTTIHDLYLSERQTLQRIQKNPYKYSRVLHFFTLLKIKKSQKKLKKLHYKLVQKSLQSVPTEFKGPAFEKTQDRFTMAVNIWQQASRYTYQICQANNIHYLQILQPNQYVEGSKILSEEEKKVAYKMTAWSKIAKQAYYLLVQSGQRLINNYHVPYADLSMIFKTVTDTLYFDNCCHFNAKGNQIMAEKIAEIIINKHYY